VGVRGRRAKRGGCAEEEGEVGGEGRGGGGGGKVKEAQGRGGGAKRGWGGAPEGKDSCCGTERKMAEKKIVGAFPLGKGENAVRNVCLALAERIAGRKS